MYPEVVMQGSIMGKYACFLIVGALWKMTARLHSITLYLCFYYKKEIYLLHRAAQNLHKTTPLLHSHFVQ
jgi:hypothetical protein